MREVSANFDLFSSLPVYSYEGPAYHVINNQRLCDSAVRQLRREKLLGFDTESKPTFTKGQTQYVSLVQLAGKDAVYLFQVDQIPVLDGILQILADPQIVKAGVSVEGDLRMLQQNNDFIAAAFAEINELSKKLGLRTLGLKKLAALLMGVNLSKPKRVTMSNWAEKELKERQIVYAATDAWISRELFLRLSPFFRMSGATSRRVRFHLVKARSA